MTKAPDWIVAHRAQWKNRGQARPSFAIAPGPGEESVWDYPRPPALAADSRSVRVETQGLVIAETTGAYRVLETASPPTFYVPPDDVDASRLIRAGGGSYCEWKGEAAYWDLNLGGDTIRSAAWSYPQPFEELDLIAGYLCFYPSRVECFVGGEKVRPQPGDYYGGWVTSEIVGPFKGEPGTGGW